MIEELLSNIGKGKKIELWFNILIYTDFSRWKQTDIKRLISFIESFVKENDEKNNILLTANTIMVLAHAWEFLLLIGKTLKIFSRQTQQLIDRIGNLSAKIVENIDDDLIETIFLGRDFKERSLIKIVTAYRFYNFLSSEKVNSLLDSIWDGANGSDCDGNLIDFSLLTYLAKSDVIYIPGKSISVKEIMTNNYVSDINNLKFWFQYKFRHDSISYAYLKEIVWSILLVVIFQYINFKYLDLFSTSQYANLSTVALQKAKVTENISTYNGINFIGMIFTSTMLLLVINKLIFNLISEFKLKYDMWTILDLISSSILLICFWFIGSISANDILDANKKSYIDNFVAVSLVVAWIRFFAYFLVIRSISKLIMTFVKMLNDTIGFWFIVVSYLLVVSSIFTTLFGGPSPDTYGSMSVSMRSMFDCMLGNYNEFTLSRNNTLHTVLRMIHIVLSNIFLVNFLIAILSSAYEYMREMGEFEYKTIKYSYIEKYQIPKLDKRGLEELVIHPAPMTIFTLILLPFSSVPKTFHDKAELFSKLMFWIENIFIILVFFIYSVLLIPLIFFKMLYNLFRSMKIYLFVPFAFVWIIFGFLFLPLYIVRDIYFLVKILWNYSDQEDNTNERIKEEAKQDRIVIYNEVIDVMKAIYYLIKKTEKNNKQHESQKNIPEYLLTMDQEEYESQKYLIDKEIIIKSWKKYRPDEQIQEVRDEDGSTTVMSNKNFITVVGQAFVDKIMTHIKNNKENEDLEEDKTGGSDNDGNSDTGRLSDVPEEEVEIIDAFLSRFLLSSDSNQKGELNLKLALKALPKRINEHNIEKINLINFSVIQISLIAFQNDDKDELFNFYDKRNMKRLYKLRTKSKENLIDIDYLKTISFRLFKKCCQVFKISEEEMIGKTEYESKSNRFEKSESASDID